MRRLTRILCGAVVVLAASTAVVAQTPAPAPAPAPAAAAPASDYYPLKKGSKWTYKVGDVTTIEMKVESVDADGATLSTSVSGKQVASESIKVTAEGVLRTKINGTEIKPAVKILQLPAKKDAKWAVDSKITVTGTDHPIKGNFTIKEEKEKVKIKDKEYECVIVDGPDFEIAGTKTAVKYWFSAGKGIVKLTYNISGQEAVLELADYTEGK